MRKNIKSTQLEMTSEIQSYLDKRLEALEKLIGPHDDAFAQIEVGKTTNHHKSGDVYRAEVNMHSKMGDFYAVAEGSDIFQAIDLVRDEILREIRSKKDRQVSFVRRSGRKVKEFLQGLVSRKSE